MKILLTGATGYLGGRLCRRLLELGHEVLAVHLNQRDQMKGSFLSSRLIRVYLDQSSPRQIIEEYGPDGIIHTATLYGRRDEDVRSLISANVIFPVELMVAGVAHGVDFFINTDSILTKYVSAYSLTKSHAAEWMQLFADKIRMIDVKLDHFYGPGDKNVKFIALMVEKLLANEPRIDLTEGSQTRDFIYIDDVVSVYETILSSLTKISRRGVVSTFEVGTGVRTSIRSIVSRLKELTGSMSVLNFGAVPYRTHEMLEYEIDNSALRGLGWKPSIMVDEGLKRVVDAARITKC